MRVGNGTGPRTIGAGTLGGFNDLKRGLIDKAVVESLQTNTDFLVLHVSS
jgi:hypothetical protein